MPAAVEMPEGFEESWTRCRLQRAVDSQPLPRAFSPSDRQPQLLQPVPQRPLRRIVPIADLVLAALHDPAELLRVIRPREQNARRVPGARDLGTEHRFGVA